MECAEITVLKSRDGVYDLFKGKEWVMSTRTPEKILEYIGNLGTIEITYFDMDGTIDNII